MDIKQQQDKNNMHKAMLWAYWYPQNAIYIDQDKLDPLISEAGPYHLSLYE